MGSRGSVRRHFWPKGPVPAWGELVRAPALEARSLLLGHDLSTAGSGIEPASNTFNGLRVIRRWAHRTFPHHQYSPIGICQFIELSTVACGVPSKFLGPKLRMRFWTVGKPTSPVPVPKAAVNEYRGTVPLQYQIRSPRQIRLVEAVAEPCLVQRPANNKLRPRIGPVDVGHHLTTPPSRNHIDHQLFHPSNTE